MHSSRATCPLAQRFAAALPLLTLLLVSLLTLGGAPAAAQTTWTVAAEGDLPAAAKQAAPTIGAALEAAAPGDTIRLLPGRHRWGAAKSASARVIPAGVVITGSQTTAVTTFPLRFAPGPAATIQGVAFRPAEEYAGKSVASVSAASTSCGGAMRIDGGASPTLISVSYDGYSADTGGALCVLEGSAPTIANAVITGSSAGQGAALYSVQSSPRLVNATVTGNGGPGAALYLAGGSPTVDNSIIWNNAGGSVTEGTISTYTITGNTTQEGLTLPDADVEIRNQATGELIGTTTTNGTGDFTFTTTTTTNYTAEVTADTDEHLDASTTLDVTGEGTYEAGTLDLNRTDYDVESDVSGRFGDVTGATIILTDGTNTYTSTTNAQGDATTTIVTPAPDVTRTTQKAGYEDNTATLTLNGERNQNDPVTLQERIYEVTANTTDEDGDPLNSAVQLTENQLVIRSGTATNGTITFQDITLSDDVYDGDTAEVTAEKTGYDDAAASIVFDKNNPNTNVDLAQDIIQYTWDVDVEDQNGDPLSGANITLEDGSDASETSTTNSTGDATVAGTVKTGIQENENISLEATLNGYQGATTTVTADPTNRTKTATLQLTEESTGQEYTLTVNTYEIGAQAFPSGDAPGVLETATLTVGDQTYDLDLSDGTETITVNVPGDVQSFTLGKDDPDYIDTSVLNFTPKTYSEQPDKQGTAITINKDDISTNQTLRYKLIPSESPDGYQTVPEISQHVNFNRSARWAEPPTIAFVQESESGSIVSDQDYNLMKQRSYDAINKTAYPFSIVEYVTYDEFLEDLAQPNNLTNIGVIRYGNNANGIQFNGDFIKNTSISAGIPPLFRQEVFEGLHGHSDAGVFNNSDGTFNDTALFYSYILSNIVTNSDI